MTRTIYGKKLLMIATITVLVTGLTLVATLDDAEAKDNKIVITGTPGDDVIFIADFGNSINCQCSGITVTGPVTGPTTNFLGHESWIINSEAGDGVDTKYEINGNGGIDNVSFGDGESPDKDKVEIENVAFVRIFDGDGNDKYKVKDSSGGSVEYNDGPGKDKLDFKG